MKTIYPDIKGYECSNCKYGDCKITKGVTCIIIEHYCSLQDGKLVGFNHCCSEFKIKTRSKVW